MSISKCVFVSVCVYVYGKDMKRETDRQNCMSWLVSCSLIRMQISCIEKHLGAFLRLTCSSFSPHSSHPLSSFLCEIQTSFLHFPYFLLSLFSVYPPVFSHSFPPSNPSPASVFIVSPSALTLSALLFLFCKCLFYGPPVSSPLFSSCQSELSFIPSFHSI